MLDQSSITVRANKLNCSFSSIFYGFLEPENVIKQSCSTASSISMFTPEGWGGIWEIYQGPFTDNRHKQ